MTVATLWLCIGLELSVVLLSGLWSRIGTNRGLVLFLSLGVVAHGALYLALADSAVSLLLSALDRSARSTWVRTLLVSLAAATLLTPWSVICAAAIGGKLAAVLQIALPALAALLTTTFFCRSRIRRLSPLRHPFSLLGAAILATALTFWLLHAHRVLERMHDDTVAALALEYALVVCAVGTLTACTLFAQWYGSGTATRPRGLLATANLLDGALLVAVLGLVVVDVRVYPALYPEFHLYLKLSTFVVLRLLASRMELRVARRSVPTRVGLFSAAAVGAIALLLLPLYVSPSSSSPSSSRSASWASVLKGSFLAAEIVRTGRRIADRDGDGFSPLLGGGDCNDTDPRVSPLAAEIPGNGKDDNCVLGDLPTKSMEAIRRARKAETAQTSAWWRARSDDRFQRNNLLLVTIDALRADHLGTYGYRRDTTPALDRLASRSTVFVNAYAQGAWTSISIPSLMKGILPSEIDYTFIFEDNTFAQHFLHDRHPGMVVNNIFTVPAQDKSPTIAGILQTAGYRTIAIVGAGGSDYFNPKFGLLNGFEETRVIQPGSSCRLPNHLTAPCVVSEAIDALARRPKDRPFFLYVHLFDTHNPYQRNRFSAWGVRRPIDLYDGCVRYTDNALSELLSWLESKPVAKQTVVIATADHGEGFREHGLVFHGTGLYNEIIRVPLLLFLPDVGAKRIEQAVGIVDIAPTVIDLLLGGRDVGFSGQSLVRSIFANEPNKRQTVASMTWKYNYDLRRTVSQRAVIDTGVKLIFDELDQTLTAFDLRKDPKEQRDISSLVSRTHPELLHELLMLAETARKAD